MSQVLFALQALTLSVRGRLDREEGATAVEYGLLVALIAAAIMATVFALGGTLDGLFSAVNDQIGTWGGEAD